MIQIKKNRHFRLLWIFRIILSGQFRILDTFGQFGYFKIIQLLKFFGTFDRFLNYKYISNYFICIYIINSVIYPGTRLVHGLVPVWFKYRNIGTVRIFEGLDPVPVSGISVRLQFGSSVPVFFPMPICIEQMLRR